MTAKTGSGTRLIYKIGSTFGTAAAGGSGDKLEGNISWDEGAEELTLAPVGSGADMANDSQRGATEPNFSYEGNAPYQQAITAAEAQFFGADSVMALVNGYAHSMLPEMNRNQRWGTLAFDGPAGSVIELISAVPTRYNLRGENFPNYLDLSMDFLAAKVDYASSTNTTSTLGSATLSGTVRGLARNADIFYLSTQSFGAFTSGEIRPITSFEVDLQYPVSFPREMKGSAGNSQPIATGEPPFQGTLTVTFKSLDDYQWTLLTASQAGTEFKAQLSITSDTLIGGSTYYARDLYFPRLKIIADPQYDLSSSSVNPFTVTFKCLVASSVVTGMPCSTFPYQILRNNKSGSYLA